MDLISKILVTDPAKRLTISQVMDHEWFKLKMPLTISDGIIIGKNQIPIEDSIIEMMRQFGFSSEEINQLFKCLDANSHNHMTTTYYLFYKQLKREGKLK